LAFWPHLRLTRKQSFRFGWRGGVAAWRRGGVASHGVAAGAAWRRGVARRGGVAARRRGGAEAWRGGVARRRGGVARPRGARAGSLSSRIVFWHPRDYGFSAPHAASVKLHFSFNSFWGGMLEGLRVEDNRFCLFGSFREFINAILPGGLPPPAPHPPRPPQSSLQDRCPCRPHKQTNRNNNVLV
jgi:hypothetical protein